MSDYPEYLNPFYEDEKLEVAKEKRKRSSSFSNTLKGFTNTLRKSFRSKSKPAREDETNDVEIRRSTYRPPARAVTYTPTNTLQRDFHTYSPALPRSRFRERLAKSHIAPPTLSEKELEESNPFKEDGDVAGEEIKPVQRPRRKKKRAPAPPGVPNSSSKWSLTSGETDTSYSNYAPSEYSEADETLEVHDENEEVKQVIQEFNRDMKKLTDDTNNNIIVAEQEKTEGSIPVVSVSCVETEDVVESAVKEVNEVEVEVEVVKEVELSRVAAIVRQLEGTTDDEKCRRLSKSDEKVANGYAESEELNVAEKAEPVRVAALAEPEDTDLDTPPQACSTPVPKMRKNRLAKNEMLGYE